MNSGQGDTEDWRKLTHIAAASTLSQYIVTYWDCLTGDYPRTFNSTVTGITWKLARLFLFHLFLSVDSSNVIHSFSTVISGFVWMMTPTSELFSFSSVTDDVIEHTWCPPPLFSDYCFRGWVWTSSLGLWEYGAMTLHQYTDVRDR